MGRARRFPIQSKLTVGALAPLLVAILLCWLAGLYLIDSQIAVQAQDRVRTDLNSAREVYLNELEHLRDVVKFTGRSPQTALALTKADTQALHTLLTPLLQNEQLDFLTVATAAGEVIFRTANPAVTASGAWSKPLVERASRGAEVGGTVVIPAAELLQENPRLGDRVAISVLPTPHSRRQEKTVEKDGMFLVAAAPVKDAHGRIAGILYGGILLNNNARLVDRIKRLVFEGVQFAGKDAGNATIFLNDLRITTNVTGPGGSRAIGSLMSEQVAERVLRRQEKWLGRAFVLDDWYFAAYEPILDLNRRVIGSLYVGMAEKPYLTTKRRLNLIYGGVLLIGSLAGIALSRLIAARLARPIRQLEQHARQVAAGERSLRMSPPANDEIGDLAGEFLQMTTALTQREEEVRELNRDLELKVRERTAELEEKHQLLLATREELAKAEKLAAIGELAAGVAHEINNPMAIIRGNTELLQLSTPPGDTRRDEIDTIYRQVSRVERIVSGLLSFARQESRQARVTHLLPLLDEILLQMNHQVPLTGIAVRKEYPPVEVEIQADGELLRQVFTNLILNAIQAMPSGGELGVMAACDPEAGEVSVTVTDSGTGMTSEQEAQIFNPFYTTKPHGTGLGLSISYGIVRDHGGRIEVESVPGEGSRFRVVLPQTPA